MTPNGLLENKTALVYGGAGSIGGAMARAFAAEGAHVFLAGRTLSTLDVVADDIRAKGGEATSAVVDALDEQAVRAFVDGVAEQRGRVDISVNVIDIGDVQRPILDLSAEEFLQPVVTAARTQFLTAIAAVKHMRKQGSGVIIMFGGSGGNPMAGIGGLTVALDAVEGFRRQFSVEFGGDGVRLVTLKTGGIAESLPSDFPGRDELEQSLEEMTMLRRTATFADVGNTAAFVASDKAATMTAATVNISCGALVD
ncbi:SDR family oxidoreductase [Saccharomonospora sp. NPDC006951]